MHIWAYMGDVEDTKTFVVHSVNVKQVCALLKMGWVVAFRDILQHELAKNMDDKSIDHLEANLAVFTTCHIYKNTPEAKLLFV